MKRKLFSPLLPSDLQVPSLTVGGALWFTDLTIADPYYLLPVTASAIFLLTVELGAADGMQARCCTCSNLCFSSCNQGCPDGLTMCLSALKCADQGRCAHHCEASLSPEIACMIPA